MIACDPDHKIELWHCAEIERDLIKLLIFKKYSYNKKGGEISEMSIKN